MHLKQTFLDYGPPHATWCFAFERYNCILGSYHTNKREIEPQVMKKFSLNQAIQALEVDEEFTQYLPLKPQIDTKVWPNYNSRGSRWIRVAWAK